MRALAGVPWETLLLLGGGFAMAAGIQESGLSGWMGAQLAAIADAAAARPDRRSPASPTVAALGGRLEHRDDRRDAAGAQGRGRARGAAPAALFAATIAASCDFALPAGTPPNAIVFGSGYVRIPVMARNGARLDLLAALVAALWCAFAVPLVL